MLEQLTSSLSTNQLALPALIASVGATLAHSLPRYLLTLYHWIKSKLTYEVTFHYSDAVFNDLSYWLAKNQDSLKFVRRERIESDTKNSEWKVNRKTDESDTWYFTPGYGSFFFKPKKHPLMILNRSREKTEQQKALVQPDILSLRGFVWQAKGIKSFIESIHRSRKFEKKNRIYLFHEGYFRDFKLVESDIKEDLLNPDFKHVENKVAGFLESEEEYRKRSLKYRLGILLHSGPGMGKSTFIAYLAKKYGMDIYYIRAKDMYGNILSAFSNVQPRSIILLEDIDTFNIGTRQNLSSDSDTLDKPISISDAPTKPAEAPQVQQTGKQTLGELLNVMDGILGYTGSILIATTNDLDALDPAMIRPGRIDLVQHIAELTPDLVIKTWASFYGKSVDGLSCKQHYPISKVQSVLQLNMKDAEQARVELGITSV